MYTYTCIDCKERPATIKCLPSIEETTTVKLAWYGPPTLCIECTEAKFQRLREICGLAPATAGNPKGDLMSTNHKKEIDLITWESVYCTTCNKNSDILMPIGKNGKIPKGHLSLGGEALSEGEKFILCGVTEEGHGLVHKARFLSAHKVEHVSAAL